MARTYNSRHRIESASHTRQAIVEAAIKMHGEGVTTLAAVAEKAGVSLPTLNKYFPTREDLFLACTAHFATQLDRPSPEALRAIEDPGERLRRVVRDVYHLHEQSMGQMWGGYRLEDESPVLARTIAESEQQTASTASILPYEDVVGDHETAYRFACAALNLLTYRALRIRNGLSFEDAVKHMTLALAGVLNIEV